MVWWCERQGYTSRLFVHSVSVALNLKSGPLNGIRSRVFAFKTIILSKPHNFSQLFWNSVGKTWLILKANPEHILGLIYFVQASPKLLKGDSNTFKCPRCRLGAAAAELGWQPVALRLRPRAHQGHRAHVALQQDHAHAAGTAPDAPVLSGGHRGPDGLVQGELARRGTWLEYAFICVIRIVRGKVNCKIFI